MTTSAPTQPTTPIRVTIVDETGSTQTDLHRLLTHTDGTLNLGAVEQWPHLSGLRARHQTAGRGRGTHTWTTTPDSSVLLSTVLRPALPSHYLPWIPIVSGLAVRDTVAEFLQNRPFSHQGSGTSYRDKDAGDHVDASGGLASGMESDVNNLVMTKWPNDVLVVSSLTDDKDADKRIPGWGLDRKIAGILTDVYFPNPHQSMTDHGHEEGWKKRMGACVVVGIGINVTQTPQELPVPWATSLALHGVQVTAEDVCARLCCHFAKRVTHLEQCYWEYDEPMSAIRQEIERTSRTLGRDVSVNTPSGTLTGRAVGISPALVLQTRQGRVEVGAGDVAYVRRAGEAEPAPLL
ncbi:biotin--[acetyl-CoA-carboxylase] ligase [Actinomyces vulturis]|uniref:biotin--[acetyl-CoA-carboxylase] ligase n=1 Tax=Actinomyces vulturis TaxID=1857645 RepID=UPI00082EBB18|nr:biotin--[acetyl-CoA-carboxylase] ligase [Actinomyces vulturis]